jgi:hypothetical protein
MADDFLAVEAPLIARLKSIVTLVPDANVLSGADLAPLLWASQPVPALHVLYHTHRPLERNPDGATRIEQSWIVAVAVRNVRDPASGAAARSAAGPILSQVLGALLGWVPMPGWRAFALANPPPSLYEVGFLLVPLAFNTVFTAFPEA